MSKMLCFMNLAKPWGGGEKWHLDHALALLEQQHSLTLIAHKKGELLAKAQKAGVPVFPFTSGNLGFLNPFKAWSLYRFFKKQHIDVLVMNFSKDLKLAAPMAKLAGVPAIVYRRGSAIPIKNTLLNRYLFGHCVTHILANSEATKKTILQHNPHLFPSEKIKVIYNGITPSEETKVAKSPTNPPVIGNLGRLVHQKGQDILLDAVTELKQRGIDCRVRIGGDGKLMDMLQQYAQTKGVADRVEFVGYVHDSSAFMRDIDIFVLPSRWEGFGYVLAEAMLARKPIVAFDISSNPELITTGLNGFLVPWGDIKAFSQAIATLIEQPELSRQLGEAGYALARQRFDFETNKQQVIEFLTHL
jgi:glycosyltransferase involved in cell wall biosynthesis